MYNISLTLWVGFSGELHCTHADFLPGVLSEKHMIIVAHWCHVAKLLYFGVWELQ